VHRKDIAVIPESVDTSLFDPKRADGAKFRLSRARAGTGTDDHGGDMGEKEIGFQLLSVFKWEHRKGWDVLLDAYWTAFEVHDDVVLRLRTYIPSFSRKQLGDNVTAHIEDRARKVFGKELSELPQVIWERGVNVEAGLAEPGLSGQETKGSGDEVDEHSRESMAHATKSEMHLKFERALTREEMRDLLASADAFVLPTRGEGWGLPIAEAMSMGLPTIGMSICLPLLLFSLCPFTPSFL
jgi:glycosyltransferase involved in cell wall biosynthesis